MERGDGSGGGEAPLQAEPQSEAKYQQSVLILACEDMFTTCAKCYLVLWATCTCVRECVLDCGGLLRTSKKEAESWGWREDEQPARYATAERDDYRARREATRRAEHTREMRRAEREAAAQQAWMQGVAKPIVV